MKKENTDEQLKRVQQLKAELEALQSKEVPVIKPLPPPPMPPEEEGELSDHEILIGLPYQLIELRKDVNAVLGLLLR